MSRARKIQRFLSQPNFVAEQFTGTPGTYVPIAETIRGFKEIVDGKHDGINEQDFFLAGSIDDVVAKIRGAKATRDFLTKMTSQSPDTTILVDEAYFDYVTDPDHDTVGRVTIVGLGPGGPQYVTQQTLHFLTIDKSFC